MDKKYLTLVNGANGATEDDTEPLFDGKELVQMLDRELKDDSSSNAGRSQQLFYDAMEADSEEDQFELIVQCLELDPGNVDAMLVLLEYLPISEADEIEVLRRVVAIGRKRLGSKAFKEFAGAFWGVHETRPYMRARERLAESLNLAGHLEEAASEWEAILELNPNDNQGVRYLLLAGYLAGGQLDDAGRLFERFDECAWNTVFAWGRVLERFLAEDVKGVESALVIAREQNEHTEAYL